VRGEDRIRLGLQGAIGDHGGRAELLAFLELVRSAFFRRLEHQHDGAADLVAHAGEDFGCAHQHRGVAVMAAGMGHRHFGAHIGLALPGGKRQSAGFRDRQCVHVGAQRHGAARPGALEHTDHASAAHAFPDFVAQRAQMLGDIGGGLDLLP